jgi:hypothetical protein
MLFFFMALRLPKRRLDLTAPSRNTEFGDLDVYPILE